MPATTETRKILIKVDGTDSKAIQDIANKMGALNKNTKSLSSNLSLLTNAFTGWVSFLGVRELTRMSDEFQNLSARLKITAQEGEKVTDILAKISSLSDRTNQSVTAVGSVYNRFAGSLASVHANSNEVVALTEVLIDTFRVAGSGADETANAMVQLSQAFSTGVLRGQDLRSVLEQNLVLSRYLKQEYGADLFKKAEAGAITISSVLRILSQHQKEILGQAKELAPTFEQTLTKAMNKVTIIVGEFSKNLGLASKFATAVAFAVDHLGDALIVVAGIMVPIAVSYIPAIVEGLDAIYVASLALLKNPLLLFLAALVAAAVYVHNNFDKLAAIFEKTRASFLDMAASIEETILPLREKIAKLTGTSAIFDFAAEKKGIESLRSQAESIRSKLAADEKTRAAKATDPYADLKSLRNKVQAGDKGKPEKLKEILAGLNKELDAGKISLAEYNEKIVSFDLYKLNREFEEGKFDIFTYNQKLKELNVQSLNRQLGAGVITLEQFNAAVSKGALEELNARFEAGRIGLTEYNNELIKISDKFEPGGALQSGTAAYLASVGTLSENVAKAITATFSHLEDNLVEFVKTGEFNFAKMTEAILDDLTRIIIRASIVKPLANAILGGFSSGSTGTNAANVGNTYDNTAAKGSAFYNGNLQKFASGGIISSPTAFSFGGGKRGLMGEAGSEAIVPLQRTSNGDLGVAATLTPVTVNIFNQSGADVEKRESTGPNGERMVDILIAGKVKQGLLTGQFDGAMKQAYGLNRKGS